MKNKVVLASASPRRRELLSQIGIEFEVMPSKSDERITKDLPGEIVMELAEGKAEEVFGNLQEKCLVIGSDTIVVHKGKIMGKPADESEAVEMLTELCGDVHQVYTGVAFVWEENDKVRSHVFYECTDVHVYPASREEIDLYVASGDPLDKAGAYGIQGQFAAFIKKIDGDYNNVVGLPVGRVYQELKGFGFL